MMDFSRKMSWLIELFILQTLLTLGCIPNIIYRVGNHNHDKVSSAFRQTWSITATHNLYCNKAKIPCMQDWVEAVGQDGFIIRQQITPESRLKKTKYRNIISKNKHSNASHGLVPFFLAWLAGLSIRMLTHTLKHWQGYALDLLCIPLLSSLLLKQKFQNPLVLEENMTSNPNRQVPVICFSKKLLTTSAIKFTV